MSGRRYQILFTSVVLYFLSPSSYLVVFTTSVGVIINFLFKIYLISQYTHLMLKHHSTTCPPDSTLRFMFCYTTLLCNGRVYIYRVGDYLQRRWIIREREKWDWKTYIRIQLRTLLYCVVVQTSVVFPIYHLTCWNLLTTTPISRISFFSLSTKNTDLGFGIWSHTTNISKSWFKDCLLWWIHLAKYSHKQHCVHQKQIKGRRERFLCWLVSLFFFPNWE